MYLLKRFSSLLVVGVLVVWASPAVGQWVEFTDETSSLLVLTSVAGNDSEEKDMATADLDRDGDLDVLVVRKRPFSEPGIRSDVLLMNEDGVLVDRSVEFGFGAGPSDARDVVCVDVDGDGWDDVVICTTFEDPIRLYMNLGEDGGGNWLGLNDESSARLGTVNESSRKYCAVGAGDVTGDGMVDLFFSNYNGGDDLLYINDGSGNFVDETAARMGSYANSAFGTSNVIVDLDGDGDQDIIKLTTLFNMPPFERGVYVLWNDGTGDFNNLPFQKIDTPQPYMFTLEDFNGDGVLDMYVVGDFADTLYLTTSVQVDTQWNYSITNPVGSMRTERFGGNLRAADIDGDGDIDLGVGPIDTDLGNCGTSRGFSLLRNTGGVLSDPVPFGSPANYNIEPHDLVYLDLNGDGCLDIFMGLCSGYRVFIQSDCDVVSGCNAADFVEPFGVFDIFDVLGFLDAFNAGDATADFTGEGAFDIFDVLGFLDAFNAGCP